MPNPIPSDRSHWLHVALIATAAVVAIAMVGAATWALTRPKPSAVPPATVIGAPDTSASATASGSVGTTGADGSATSPEDTGTLDATLTAATGTTVSGPKYRLAFRLAGSLTVATLDARTLATMRIGGLSYALSPDGRRIAAAQNGRLVVALSGQLPSANSSVTPGLTAEDVKPVWLPDSSAVLFVRASANGMSHIWRYTLATRLVKDLGPGAAVAVSPNGSVIAALPAENASTTALTVWGVDGVARSVPVPEGDPGAVAVGRSRIFVSTLTSAGNAEIWSMAADGSGAKRLVSPGSAGGLAVTYGELMVSPDGSKLLYAADADDGYSRLWYVALDGGSPHEISGRRDGYALRWSDDSKGIYFIEGNAFQGQATSLYFTDLAKRHRRLLVSGATL